jgi:regulator of protease activity HflC (stomatin/prohibitin superfamily)
LTATELGLRELASWFLPRSAPVAARAAVDSTLASLIVGATAGRGVTAPIRSYFGIDFSRSWALAYLRGASLPAAILTLLFCWGLSGVTLIGLDRRGVYERLGTPAAMLGPGLHLILPWPLGRVRPVEFGIVHEVALGGDPNAGATALVDAEGPAPPGADRLWNRTHPDEVSYVIASETRGRQDFQTVSADIRILYRIGLNDEDALRSVYHAADPTTLVRAAAGRLLSRFFAEHTLGQVLSTNRETFAEDMRAALARDLARSQSGVEVVGAIIEAIHPPVGAADAYHAVQAAEINASSSISFERGRAKGTAAMAQEEAYRLIAAAHATGEETVAASTAEATHFAADVDANAVGGRAFVLERYLGDLSVALARSPLTIIDNRLDGAQAPVVDLRPLAAVATATPGIDDTSRP